MQTNPDTAWRPNYKFRAELAIPDRSVHVAVPGYSVERPQPITYWTYVPSFDDPGERAQWFVDMTDSFERRAATRHIMKVRLLRRRFIDLLIERDDRDAEVRRQVSAQLLQYRLDYRNHQPPRCRKWKRSMNRIGKRDRCRHGAEFRDRQHLLTAKEMLKELDVIDDDFFYEEDADTMPEDINAYAWNRYMALCREFWIRGEDLPATLDSFETFLELYMQPETVKENTTVEEDKDEPRSPYGDKLEQFDPSDRLVGAGARFHGDY